MLQTEIRSGNGRSEQSLEEFQNRMQSVLEPVTVPALSFLLGKIQ